MPEPHCRDFDKIKSDCEALERAYPEFKSNIFQVVAPGKTLRSFSKTFRDYIEYCPPHKLTQTKGSTWAYQGLDDLVSVVSSHTIGGRWWLTEHYERWKAGVMEKTCHPVFSVVSGPGTGKSRMLDEAPTILSRSLERKLAAGNDVSALTARIASALLFSITFENGTPIDDSARSADVQIGARMIKQMIPEMSMRQIFDTMPWSPVDVIAKLAESIGIPVNDLSVILCVDSIQHFAPERQKDVVACLAGLANAGPAFVIPFCCSFGGLKLRQFFETGSY